VGVASQVEPPTANRDAGSFDCGVMELDGYLQRHALANQAAGARARTWSPLTEP